MGCQSQVIRLVLIFSQLLLAALFTAPSEDAVVILREDAEDMQRNPFSMAELIQILFKPTLDNANKTDKDNTTLNILNVLGDLMCGLSEGVGVNVAQQIRQLYSLNKEKAKKELISVAKNIEWASKALNEGLSDSAEDLNQWETMRAKNRDRLHKSLCEVFDGVISSSSKQLHTCCKVTMKPILPICRNFRNLLIKYSGYMTYAAHFIARIHVCLDVPFNQLEHTTPCLDIFNKEINNLIFVFEGIVQKLIRLLRLRVIYSNCCISIALVEENERV